MLPWLIWPSVYNSLANSDDFMKFAVVTLMQTRLNFQNVWESLGNNDTFMKNDENTLRFKGKSWESLYEKHQKTQQQQRTQSATYGF